MTQAIIIPLSGLKLEAGVKVWLEMREQLPLFLTISELKKV